MCWVRFRTLGGQGPGEPIPVVVELSEPSARLTFRDCFLHLSNALGLRYVRRMPVHATHEILPHRTSTTEACAPSANLKAPGAASDLWQAALGLQ